MKNTFKLEVLNTKRVLTRNEQNKFRQHLKPLLKLNGLVSMCLEAESLYVEFNPELFDIATFKLVLSDINFPLDHKAKIASYHYAV
jgi:hypothetical protein